MSKRVKSKAFVSDSDSDGEPIVDKTQKKAKKVEKDGDNLVWEENKIVHCIPEDCLGKKKKLSISEYRGTRFVSIREFYDDKATGEERPGKKGITLNRQQWDEFMKVVEEVNSKFTK